MVYLIMIVIIAVVFSVCGALMVYSSVSGKYIAPPEPNALFQLRAQYKLRGLIGIVFILIGVLILIGIFKTF